MKLSAFKSAYRAIKMYLIRNLWYIRERVIKMKATKQVHFKVLKKDKDKYSRIAHQSHETNSEFYRISAERYAKHQEAMIAMKKFGQELDKSVNANKVPKTKIESKKQLQKWLRN